MGPHLRVIGWTHKCTPVTIFAKFLLAKVDDTLRSPSSQPISAFSRIPTRVPPIRFPPSPVLFTPPPHPYHSYSRRVSPPPKTPPKKITFRLVGGGFGQFQSGDRQSLLPPTVTVEAISGRELLVNELITVSIHINITIRAARR